MATNILTFQWKKEEPFWRYSNLEECLSCLKIFRVQVQVSNAVYDPTHPFVSAPAVLSALEYFKRKILKLEGELKLESLVRISDVSHNEIDTFEMVLLGTLTTYVEEEVSIRHDEATWQEKLLFFHIDKVWQWHW